MRIIAAKFPWENSGIVFRRIAEFVNKVVNYFKNSSKLLSHFILFHSAFADAIERIMNQRENYEGLTITSLLDHHFHPSVNQVLN